MVWINRTKTPTSYSRRLRSIDGIGTGIGRAGKERECGSQEDGGLYACAVGGEEEVGGAD